MARSAAGALFHKICKSSIYNAGTACLHKCHDLLIRNGLGGTFLLGDHGSQSVAEPTGLIQRPASKERMDETGGKSISRPAGVDQIDMISGTVDFFSPVRKSEGASFTKGYHAIRQAGMFKKVFGLVRR